MGTMLVSQILISVTSSSKCTLACVNEEIKPFNQLILHIGREWFTFNEYIQTNMIKCLIGYRVKALKHCTILPSFHKFQRHPLCSSHEKNFTNKIIDKQKWAIDKDPS